MKKRVIIILLLCLLCSGCIAGTTRVVIKTERDGVDYEIEYELDR
jgi:serine protease inhibitor